MRFTGGVLALSALFATTATAQNAFAVDEARLKLRRDFMGRLGKALPPRKLVRFFQIENKLDSVVRADISRQIPLAP